MSSIEFTATAPTGAPALHMRFGRYLVRGSSRELLVDDVPVKLSARAFELLLTLVDSRGHVISKEELMERIWPGLVVEENNIQVHISALRKALGAQAIATIPGRGYQFTLRADEVTSAALTPQLSPTHSRAQAPSPPQRAAQEAAASSVNNLPRQLTSFVGRDVEMAAVHALLGTHRLMTLVGSGGCGKTRLGVQVAEKFLPLFPGGIWFLELAPLADSSTVLPAVANTFGVKEESGKPLMKTLAEHLLDKQLLLFLDNCEHLLDAVAQVADTLLRQCPDLKILASSRQALGLAGEQTYRVPSLSLPDRHAVQTPQSLSQFESIQLFVERARLLRADFAVTADNATPLASLCCQLDGIPLAIELAAARLNLLSVADIDRKLSQRFRLLTGGARAGLPRHQTLQALFDWSYALLNASEKLMLQRLSVFAGGWSLEAAEAVCAGDGVAQDEIVDLLAQLGDKSLLVAEQTQATARFRLLESVRQFALEQLAQSPHGANVRMRHAAFYLNLVEASDSNPKPSAQLDWLETLEAESDNLLASLEWSVGAQDAPAMLRLCAALGGFWIMQGRLSQGREWCERILQPSTLPTTDAVRALNAAGALALYQGDFDRTRHWHEAALAMAQALADPRGMAAAHLGLGLLALSLGLFEQAQEQSESSLKVAQKIADQGGIAMAMGNLGAIAMSTGNFEVARDKLEHSLAWAKQSGKRWYAASLLLRMGVAACFDGDCDTAQTLLEESLSICQSFKDLSGTARALSGLGLVAHDKADYAKAETLYRQSALQLSKLSDKSVTAIALEGLAEVLAARGDPQRAAIIWGAMQRLRADIGAPLRPAWRSHCERSVAAARLAFNDEARFERAWAEGRRLTFEEAVALSLAA